MIQDNKMSLTGLLTWIICTLFFMYEFLMRTILGTFQPQLIHDLHLTTVEFALLSTTMYQLIYGIMQIPAGLITDRLGLKKTLCTAVILCTIANLGFSLTHDFTTAILFRMLAGLGSSCGFICLLIAIYDWMPRKNIALFIGISQFIGTLGPMAAAGPLHSLSMESSMNWRDVFYYLAAIGAVLSILIFLYVNSNRQARGKFIILSHSSSLLTDLYQLIKQKQVWFIALYSAFVFFAIEYLTENEGSAFLIKKGFSSTFSSYMMTISWLGYAISCPMLGFFSDKIQRRKPFMILSSLITLTALVGIIYLPLNNALITFCFILLGAGAGGSIIGFAIMAEQCTEATRAAALGFNNTMIVLSTALNAPLIGFVLSRMTKTGHVLQLANYQEAFIVILLLVLTAIFVVFFAIKETFCKSTCSNTILNIPEAQLSMK